MIVMASLSQHPSPSLSSRTSAHKRDGNTDSEADAYGARYAPSTEYPAQSDYATQTATDFHNGPTREPYAAWTVDRQIPLSKEYVNCVTCVSHAVAHAAAERSKTFSWI
jgi:hypothetical protein